MSLDRVFKVSDLDCGHRFLTEKYEWRRGDSVESGPTFRCEVCGDWSVGHTIETLTA